MERLILLKQQIKTLSIFEKKMFTKYDKVFSVSKNDQSMTAKIVDKERTAYIPNCVNASLNGIWKGFFVNASKNDRVKIDIKINSYFKFLIERRNLIRLNSKQKFSK